jgi:cytoskeletal protein RodZ
MPETRGEWIFFVIGAFAIAALVALIVFEKTDRFDTRHPTTAATSEAAAPEQAAAMPETTTAPDAARGETTAAPEPGQVTAGGVSLRLTATADTWFEIRSGSADGDVLYSGILPQGGTKRFRSTQLWASFGSASNLTARLNGKPLHLLPGTYMALVGAGGLQPLNG